MKLFYNTITAEKVLENKEYMLIAGGAGFIGSAFCRKLSCVGNYNLIILDKLTYASNLNSIKKILEGKNNILVVDSIGNKKNVKEILEKYNPKFIINFAAETHVDNSISNPNNFIKTNVLETHNFLNTVLKYYKSLSIKKAQSFKFFQISTDEVYGDIDVKQKPVCEKYPYNPSSPYSASKAAGDHLVRAYFRTYGFPGLITNCSNNYGPFQHHEKFIPTVIKNLLAEKKVPVYGNGKQIREWIYVDDHCKAILDLISHGKLGESYNIGSGIELTNLDIINKIIICMKELSLINKFNIDDHVNFVEDRLGHDKRYSIDSSKIFKLCKWKSDIKLKDGLKQTICSFKDNLN